MWYISLSIDLFSLPCFKMLGNLRPMASSFFVTYNGLRFFLSHYFLTPRHLNKIMSRKKYAAHMEIIQPCKKLHQIKIYFQIIQEVALFLGFLTRKRQRIKITIRQHLKRYSTSRVQRCAHYFSAGLFNVVKFNRNAVMK